MLRNRLRELMAKQDLTIKGLVEATGISRNTLSNIVNNPHANVSTKTLSKLCRTLNVDPGEFYEWELDIDDVIKQLRR